MMSKNPTLSYFHNIGKDPLRALTLGSLLEISANKFGNRKAILGVQQNQSLTFESLLESADKFAAGLLVLGLKKGDRLGLWGPNMIEWHVVNMACVRMGVLMVALNPASQATEMEYYVNKVKVKVIVCPYEGKHQNYYTILEELIPELKTAESGSLNCTKVPSIKNIVIISHHKLRGTHKYSDILELANQDLICGIKSNQHLIQPDEACYIQFSSGTTGQPKAAVASHFQVVNNSFQIGKRNELDQKHHKICVQVPFFHVFGTTTTLAAALHFGATIVVGSPVYNPIENLKALKEENCTSVYGTPTMFVDLIQAQSRLKLDFSPEIAVIGAAPCSPELLKKIRQKLNVKKIKPLYGLTEVSCICFQSMSIHDDESVVTSTVGHLGDHLEAKVIDDQGNIVPMGTPGELCIRGYSTMLGYWEDEEKTKEMIGADKWLKTGDQFILQEDGYGRIVGRLKDVIIRGGENIFPKEIEDLLNTHPDILESQVIGLPHERLGEEVCACVRLKKESSLTYSLMFAFLHSKLSYSKIPSQLKIVEEFPKTTSGKIQKFKLAHQFSQL